MPADRITTAVSAADAPVTGRPEPGEAWKPPAPTGTVLMLLSRLLRVGLRQPVFGFIFPIVFPVVLLAFVSSMFERLADLPGFPLRSYTAYLAPGILMLIPMIGAGYGAGTLIDDFRSGFVDRLRLQGVGANAIVASKMLFEIVRILPAGLIVSALLVALGAPLRAGLLSVALSLVVMCAWSAAYSTLFYLVAIRTLNPQAPIALLPLLLPVLFISSALMPEEFLPAWLQVAIQFNPFTHIVDATASIQRGPTVMSDLAAGAASIVVTFVALQLVLRRLIRRRLGT